MIGIIAAVTQNNVIGVDGKIPFDYPEDIAHFKSYTLNNIVIMGRITFEGIGKPLAKRTNIVITSKELHDDRILTFSSIEQAMRCQEIQMRKTHIWFIGGNKIYEEGMKYADNIFLTRTPDIELNPNAIKFPQINFHIFKKISAEPFGEDSPLILEKYEKINY